MREHGSPQHDGPAGSIQSGDSPVFPADQPLPLTGERTTPGVPEENYWFCRHVAAYRFAARCARGLRTLDAGCGEGYGADILAAEAREVLAVDLDEAVVRRARTRYRRASFEPADLVALPFPGGSFEAVVSLQVIEHLPRPEDLVREAARVLAPGGLLVTSTPNRLTFSPNGLRNPFHTFEFAPGELRALLARHFPRVGVLGTAHGPRLRAVEAAIRGTLPERLIAQPAPEWPRWLRAVVARVRASDFAVSPRRVERSLDLIAVARRPR
ncbi:MAG: methyltransferase domain-containing protein [Acidobacteria bacterium]|nr:methyltransferase domain-containing protein [Acidobacteriota bacterium]